MRIDWLPRRTPFRIALGLFAVFVLGTLLSNLIALRVIDRELDGRREMRLLEQLAQLKGVYAAGGPDDLSDAVDAIATAVDAEAGIAVLVAGDGTQVAGTRVLAGHRVDWPEGLSREDTAELVEDVEDPEHAMLLVTDTIDGGYRITLGASEADGPEVAEIVLGAFGWGTLVLFAVSAGGTALVASRFGERIDAVRRTMNHVADGRLSARLVPSGRGDDLDALAVDVNRALERLERAVGQVRQASNDIAHDLRTPLGRLRISLEKAADEHRAGIDVQARLEAALDECDTLGGTFSALLRIARLESGARRASFEPVDLAAVLHRVVDLHGEAAEDGGRSLVLFDGGSLSAATVQGDAELLLQLFSNLVENALQHAPVGTRVSCALRLASGRVDAIVSDDGPGIPVAERENVFRRLYRLDSSRTDGGSGLGLALVKAVADLHGAAITLEDDEPGLRVVVAFRRA